MVHEFTVSHICCGSGGAALGFQQAVEEYKGAVGRFKTLVGIDVDNEACEDFRNLTGAPAVQMDLFRRQDYVDFHGQEPPALWKEMTPADIRATTQGVHPDAVFISAPCQGNSGLLSEEKANTPKYIALNNLAYWSVHLTIKAWEDDPPALIFFENVPWITKRSPLLLKKIRKLLEAHGYAVHPKDDRDGFHDCGVIGGLAEHRRRYLMVARHKEKVSTFLYNPPVRRVRAIGEVLDSLPFPDDPAAGPMHRQPRLTNLTWFRLSRIRPGGDWRDLNATAPELLRLRHTPRKSSYGVNPYHEPAATIIGNMRVGGSQVSALADIRNVDNLKMAGIYNWVEDGSVAMDDILIEDLRLRCSCRNGSYGVQDYNQPANTIAGYRGVHSGSIAVADPRIHQLTYRPDPPPIIISPWGTWNRPYTTFEMAMIQTFPAFMPDGRPLQLAGKSEARWKKRIGNAVPPHTAKAIAEQALMALLPSLFKEWTLGATGIWVMPKWVPKQEEVVLNH